MSGLPAEPAGADQLFEEARGCVIGVAEFVVNVGDHIKAHVKADEVAELEGTKKEPEPLSRAHTSRLHGYAWQEGSERDR